MKIYIAMIEDRHCETQAYPFSTLQKAVDFAKNQAETYCLDEEDIEELQIEGFLFYLKFSCEDDCVWVVERYLDDDT